MTSIKSRKRRQKEERYGSSCAAWVQLQGFSDVYKLTLTEFDLKALEHSDAETKSSSATTTSQRNKSAKQRTLRANPTNLYAALLTILTAGVFGYVNQH